MKKTKEERKPVDLKTVKTDKEGYKSVTTSYDSEFIKWIDDGQIFVGKFVEIIQAGKKGKEKPTALFQEKTSGKSILIGNKMVVDAVENYGQKEYRITYKGKVEGKNNTYCSFDIAVK